MYWRQALPNGWAVADAALDMLVMSEAEYDGAGRVLHATGVFSTLLDAQVAVLWLTGRRMAANEVSKEDVPLSKGALLSARTAHAPPLHRACRADSDGAERCVSCIHHRISEFNLLTLVRQLAQQLQGRHDVWTYIPSSRPPRRRRQTSALSSCQSSARGRTATTSWSAQSSRSPASAEASPIAAAHSCTAQCQLSTVVVQATQRQALQCVGTFASRPLSSLLTFFPIARLQLARVVQRATSAARHTVRSTAGYLNKSLTTYARPQIGVAYQTRRTDSSFKLTLPQIVAPTPALKAVLRRPLWLSSGPSANAVVTKMLKETPSTLQLHVTPDGRVLALQGQAKIQLLSFFLAAKLALECIKLWGLLMLKYMLSRWELSPWTKQEIERCLVEVRTLAHI